MTAYAEALTDSTKLSDSPFAAYGVKVAVTVGLHDAPSWQAKLGAKIADAIKFSSSFGLQTTYRPILLEQVLLRDALSRGIPIHLLETVNLEALQAVARGVIVLERLFLKDTPDAPGTYSLALVDALVTSSKLLQFFGGFLSDSVQVGETLTRLYRGAAQVGEVASLTDLLGHYATFQFVLSDGVELTDEEAVQAIYNGYLQDFVSLQCGWVLPSGSFTTWAINTRTGAVTEYDNFTFSSYAQMGRRFLATTDDGLWVLDGELDAGQAIETRFGGGYMDLGDSNFTSFKSIYVGMRVQDNAKDFYLKLRAGDGREYLYKFRPEYMATSKVNLGKGLRSRYFSWELITQGPDFSMDSIEFVPIIAKRRV